MGKYDADGNVTKNVLGNGSFTYFDYDALNRPVSIKNCLPDGSALAYFDYTCDQAGRITECLRETGHKESVFRRLLRKGHFHHHDTTSTTNRWT